MTREPTRSSLPLGSALAIALAAAFLPLMVAEIGASQPAVDPSVRASAQGGRVRVIVEVRVVAADAAGTESAIARAQDTVLARLPQQHASVARRYTSIPMIALEIDGTALAALEAMADVVSVKADELARPQ